MFWKYDTIAEREFLKKADTGDILLFRTIKDQFGPRITRTFTASHFDHVAMILKFENEDDELFVIDATAG